MAADVTRRRWWLDVLGVLLAVAAAYVMFGPALREGRTLSGGDLVLWVPEFVRTHRVGLFFPRWFPYYYAGLAQQFQFLSQAAVVMVLAPPFYFHAAAFAVDVCIAGAGTWFLLRAWKLHPGACAVGTLAYPLSNHLVTWVQAGHLWKYDTTCWTPWLLLALGRAHDTGRWGWFAWAGAFLGLHLLGGDVQLAYYVGLVVAAMTLVRAAGRWRQRRTSVRPPLAPGVARRQIAGHVLCALIAVGFGAEVVQHYAHVLRTQSIVAGESAADQWKFSTEFSLPPEETVSLIAGGGVFGWTLDGPHYWGRSVARRTDDYLGITAVCFAVCALVVRRDRRTAWWAAVAAAALVLAYGKYLPAVYRGVHALPFMGALRNPNRLLFVTAWATSLLAALGADGWLRAHDDARALRRLRGTVAGVAVFVAVLVGIGFWVDAQPEWWRDRLYPWLSRGNADVAEVGYRLTVFRITLMRAGLLGLAWAGLSAAWLLTGRSRLSISRVGMPLLVVALVGADLALHAQPFVRTYAGAAAYARSDLIDRLQSPPLGGRVKLWQETGELHDEVAYRFPYFGVPSVDVISSRRPPEYTAVLRAWREQRLSTDVALKLFHVTTLLAPGPLPPGAPATDLLGVFDGAHVFALRAAVPRAEVVGDFNVLDRRAILARMAEPDFDPSGEVLLEVRPPVRLSAYRGPVEGTTSLTHDTPHRLEITATASRPAMLLVHDLYDRYWRATVNGAPAPLLRADGFLRAIPLPQGDDLRVVLTYAPPRWPWVLTVLGWIGFCAGCLAWPVVQWRRGRNSEAPAP